MRSAYMDAGGRRTCTVRGIYLLTQDQFSYTAAVCGIMVRDKPAANFFMGYYYAEALLAETARARRDPGSRAPTARRSCRSHTTATTS